MQSTVKQEIRCFSEVLKSVPEQDLLPQIFVCQRQLYFPSNPELILIVHRQWSVVKVPAKTIALFINAATAINY